MKFDVKKIENIIRDVVAEAVMPRWRNLGAGDISEKQGPQDLVTIADGACEKALSARLLDLYPNTKIVGEEICESEQGRMQLFGGTDPVWVIDPIDGTMAFANGQPQFDCMLALVHKKELLAGWIFSPTDNDFYIGEKGAGAMRLVDGHSINLSPVAKDKPLSGLTGILGKKFFSTNRLDELKAKKTHFADLVETVNAGHDYARMARGEAQFAIYGKTMPWDHMPGLAILSALGFMYAKHDGRDYLSDFEWQGGLLIAPQQSDWQALRDILF